MTDPLVSRFCAQLRTEGFEGAALLESALHAIDIEADYNVHATCMWEAIKFVLGREGRTVAEKVIALNRVLTNSGVLRLPQDVGW
jgi:hypothetical protein